MPDNWGHLVFKWAEDSKEVESGLMNNNEIKSPFSLCA